MRRKAKYLILTGIFSTLVLSGCVEGDMQEDIQEKTVKYEVMLNSGRIFVYTFEDPETGVWYIATAEGVTPRLKEDGMPYKK